jgi:fumarylacetoacetase
MDFELEMGFVLAASNNGKAVSPDDAESYMAGLVVVNDWSARDVQRLEYQPLGPFLAKSFSTTISPWLVTLDALEPFRVDGMPQDPEPLPHLAHSIPRRHFDVQLEVSIQTAKMTKPQVICHSNMDNLYWTPAQQLAHQTSNGTLVQPGDLYASGTISGSEKNSFGSMLELSWKGQEPIQLDETGEFRTFLEDGDTVVMTAFAQGNGFRIGFGEARGTIEST